MSSTDTEARSFADRLRTPEGRICLGLFGAVLLVYVRVVSHEFMSFDDPLYVVENPAVNGGLSLDAGSHRMVNVLLHASSSVLLFLALGAMTGALWPSAVAAALFALHPLRVESVAWVSERKDVLGGFSFMATLLAYSRHVLAPSVGRYAAIFVSFALGLMSKPMLVTLPMVLLLLITLDTTRPDHLGAYGYERNTSPCLDELARDSVVFDRAYSTSSWTLPTHARC